MTNNEFTASHGESKARVGPFFWAIRLLIEPKETRVYTELRRQQKSKFSQHTGRLFQFYK